MMFILNRTNDWATEPKPKILLRTIAWFVAMIVISTVIIAVTKIAYMVAGIDPNQLTKFGGDVSNRVNEPLVKSILLLLVIAPLVEEIIFRLGLSFRRQTVALWVGLLPVAIAAYLLECRNWVVLTALVLVGVALFWLIVRFTTDEQWAAWRSRYLRLAMWISAIAFALIHLKAFTVISWTLLPWCLAFILRPGLVGCAITYARVNLGFWWGVLFHVINNIPGVLYLLAMSTQ